MVSCVHIVHTNRTLTPGNYEQVLWSLPCNISNLIIKFMMKNLYGYYTYGYF